MKKNLFNKIIILSLLTFQFQSEIFAHNDHENNINIKSMAKILLEMNHFPSDSNKKVLQNMINSNAATKNEKIIANAILKIKHSNDTSDEVLLQSLIDDADTTKAIKNLSRSILTFNHNINSSDRENLEIIIF